ncbi:MAG: isocitrate lyase/PEP mutase family protein [Candidatus Rokubacteria bacterium]|nr:isocitrate lyase/PEP mutase family protein [Candidatus Rokubacteria bacterium]
MKSRRKTFREKLQRGATLWIPGAYDVMSARLIEEAGFDGVLVSGFGVSASLLGLPDAELYTMTENLGVTRQVASAVGIPVMADADTGYGNALNVMRTVREFEATGVASITLEDQVSPKKCPAVSDQTDVVPLEEAVAKIRAAVAARRDPGLVIIARTDARDPAEATRRAQAFAAAGADVVKPISKCFTSLEALQELKRACRRPLAISVIGWIERDLTPAQIESLGGIATFPLTPLLTVAGALRRNLARLAATKSTASLPVPPMPEGDFKTFIGFEEIERLERAYLVG